MNELADALNICEQDYQQKSGDAAAAEAKRKSLLSNIGASEARLNKCRTQIESAQNERRAIERTPEQREAYEGAQQNFEAAQARIGESESAYQKAEDERQQYEQAEQACRAPLHDAEKSLTEISAERDALKKLLAAGADQDWQPLIELVNVAPGYENALAAALGDDLGAALDEAAAAHWSSYGDTAS